MTPEQAKKLIEVLQWIVDGKEVEFRRKLEYMRTEQDRWVELGSHDYVDVKYEYRLKPREPLEGYANLYSNCSSFTMYPTFRDAHLMQDQYKYPCYLRTAKFREVIEETNNDA